MFLSNNNKHNWVVKMINWKLYEKLKLDHTTKRYMHKHKSNLENKMNKILCELEKQTDH